MDSVKVEVITIGDEILIGQVVDTNATFIGKALNAIGVEVFQITSIRDDQEHILEAWSAAQRRVDVVLITGGLGPTKDDITKHTWCGYFQDTLVENAAVLKHVTALFSKYVQSPINEINRKQALVPSKATVLHNRFGTAPGLWMEKEGVVFVAMPGVPFEMQGLMENEVIPRLKKRFARPYILHKTVLTQGVPESVLALKIEDWEAQLPAFLKLAYLPNYGSVRLRLSARGSDKKKLEKALEIQFMALHQLIGTHIVGYEDETSLEQRIGALLQSKKQTLALAESCTGGRLAAVFTKHPGSSSFFRGGVVAYATSSKTEILEIPTTLITQHSVTSKAVAEAMALAAKRKFGSDYAIGTTGNAGPNKGDGGVEVGTVFIAIATPESVFCEKYVFSNHRTRTIGKAVNKAMAMLQTAILAQQS